LIDHVFNALWEVILKLVPYKLPFTSGTADRDNRAVVVMEQLLLPELLFAGLALKAHCGLEFVKDLLVAVPVAHSVNL